MIKTDVEEFKRFHTYITRNNPGYDPWYILLQRGRKDPEGGIQFKQPKGRLTFAKACEFMAKGHNIGIVATGNDRLVILDRDNPATVGTVKQTLSITSRKRTGDHNFYFTDDPVADKKDIYLDSAKQNITTESDGEMRCVWQFVVVAGSFVEFDLTNPKDVTALANIPESEKHNAGKYTIKSDVPVATITYQELPDVFKKSIEDKRKAGRAKQAEDAKHKIRNQERLVNHKNDTAHKSHLWDISLSDIIGSTPDRQRFSSLFHDSSTGMNTSVSNGLLHCWRHSVTHSPLSALAVDMGMITCSQGYSHGSGVSSLNLRDGETVFKLWVEAKRRGLISKDDPVPTSALTWYAVSAKLCTGNEITDGWKLPPEVYNKAIILLDTAGTPAGRKLLSPQQNKQFAGTNPCGIKRIKCEGFLNAGKGVEGTITCQRVAESLARGYIQWSDAPEDTTIKIVKKFCKLCRPPLDFEIMKPIITELYDVPMALPVCDNMIFAGLCEHSSCKPMKRHRQEQERIAFLQLKEIIKKNKQQPPSPSPAPTPIPPIAHPTAETETKAPEQDSTTISREVPEGSITTDTTPKKPDKATRQRVLSSVKAWQEAKGKAITKDTLPDVLEWIFHDTGISTSIARQCIIVNTTIKPLKDIPDFVGIDGVLYTLKAGAIATLPEIHVKGLIKRKGAVEA